VEARHEALQYIINFGRVVARILLLILVCYPGTELLLVLNGRSQFDSGKLGPIFDICAKEKAVSGCFGSRSLLGSGKFEYSKLWWGRGAGPLVFIWGVSCPHFELY
jgi:hypothetical protein